MNLVPLTEVVSTLESGSRPKGGIKDIAFGIPSLGAEHLTDDGRFKLKKLKLIPFSFYESMKKGKIKYGDILIVKDGATTGKVSYVDSSFPYEKASINEHLFQLKVDRKRAFAPYVFWYLHNGLGNKQILQDFRGATVGGISRGFTDKVIVPLPPLPEQKRIAAILDKADAIRRKRQLAIEKSEDFLRAVFLDMFGDPVTNPKGWETVKLGGLCGVGSSKRVFVSEFVEAGIPFYRGTEVGKLGAGEHINPDLFISPEHYQNLVQHSGRPEIGDLLLPSICHDGRIWKVDNENPFYFKDGRVLWIKNHESKIDIEYLRSYLQQIFIANYSSIASGTTFAELKIVNLKNLSLLYPPLELQKKYSKIVELKFQSIKNLKEVTDLCDNLFSSLTHLAFRGELTHQAAEELLEAAAG